MGGELTYPKMVPLVLTTTAIFGYALEPRGQGFIFNHGGLRISFDLVFHFRWRAIQRRLAPHGRQTDAREHRIIMHVQIGVSQARATSKVMGFL